MRVLWLCNVMLPEFCDEFGFKKVNVGGWLTGMWNEMKNVEDLQLGIACPIKDWARAKDGKVGEISYYSFPFSMVQKDLLKQEEYFCKMIERFSPDIIHIWGTEYQHTLAMVNAAESKGMLDCVVINIQGLVSFYANAYTLGLPDAILDIKKEGEKSIREGKEDFEERGTLEKKALEKARNVIGRTAWDKACVTQINSQITYWKCNEILRDAFYQNKGQWNYEQCQKYSIFISQANYPIKGFHKVIGALRILVEQFPLTHVYVAGANLEERKGVYASYIMDLIEENDLKNYVTFLGSLTEEDMCEQYIRANVFVSASSIENESNSVAEAKIIGTPVIASYVGGIESSMKHGEDSFVYPFHEEYMLAYYVGQLFETKSLANQFSENGRTEIEKIVDKEINLKQNIDIYKNLVKHECSNGSFHISYV